jgi:hypothetical protein
MLGGPGHAWWLGHAASWATCPAARLGRVPCWAAHLGAQSLGRSKASTRALAPALAAGVARSPEALCEPARSDRTQRLRGMRDIDCDRIEFDLTCTASLRCPRSPIKGQAMDAAPGPDLIGRRTVPLFLFSSM